MGSIPVGSTKKGLNVSFGPFFCAKNYCVFAQVTKKRKRCAFFVTRLRVYR